MFMSESGSGDILTVGGKQTPSSIAAALLRHCLCAIHVMSDQLCSQVLQGHECEGEGEREGRKGGIPSQGEHRLCPATSHELLETSAVKTCRS